MQRRDLFKEAGLGAAVAATSQFTSAQSADAAILGSWYYRSVVPEIFAPSPIPAPHSEAIVIGSGFGAVERPGTT